MTQPETRPAYDDEVRADIRYEKGLVVKAGVAIVLVLVVIALRILFI
jgi:hypothetical protein